MKKPAGVSSAHPTAATEISQSPSDVVFYEKTKQSFTNFGPDFRTKNRNTFKKFSPGAGFSGIFDEISGKFLLRPSGWTYLKGDRFPRELMPRNRGHEQVFTRLAELVETRPETSWAFAVEKVSDNSVRFAWHSRSHNERYRSRFETPEQLRPRIISAFQEAVGQLDVVTAPVTANKEPLVGPQVPLDNQYDFVIPDNL